MLTTEQIAWCAGVIDARGHIALNDRHGHPQPRIRVTTSKVSLLQALAEMTGSKVVMDDRGYQKRPCGEHCRDKHVHVARQSAQWTVDSARATVVLAAITPYMHAQRDEALAALRVGLKSFPARRGDSWKKMQALGWPIPEVEGVE